MKELGHTRVQRLLKCGMEPRMERERGRGQSLPALLQKTGFENLKFKLGFPGSCRSVFVNEREGSILYLTFVVVIYNSSLSSQMAYRILHMYSCPGRENARKGSLQRAEAEGDTGLCVIWSNPSLSPALSLGMVFETWCYFNLPLELPHPKSQEWFPYNKNPEDLWDILGPIYCP